MAEIIKTEKLCRDFKSGFETVHALKNVTITIEQRTLTILRGRSGSGKTTLINLLGAMDFPTDGKIYFGGEEITSMPDIKRDELRRASIGFVFQSGALISNMNAFENVEFGLRIAGYNPKERAERALECLHMVGLSKRVNHFPYELSGGEAQRVAIARAIAHRPKVIFADEPTAALDTNMGLQVVKAFKDMVEKEGLTVVMTTHDPNMIEIADFVYTLADGEIVNE
jgi:putative ABC transport system ATP-binding protein